MSIAGDLDVTRPAGSGQKDPLSKAAGEQPQFGHKVLEHLRQNALTRYSGMLKDMSRDIERVLQREGEAGR